MRPPEIDPTATLNPLVEGSNPSGPTNHVNGLAEMSGRCFLGTVAQTCQSSSILVRGDSMRVANVNGFSVANLPWRSTICGDVNHPAWQRQRPREFLTRALRFHGSSTWAPSRSPIGLPRVEDCVMHGEFDA